MLTALFSIVAVSFRVCVRSCVSWVNCWLHRDLRVPFGGVKESGMGTEGGKHSLEFYSCIKNICVHHGRPIKATL